MVRLARHPDDRWSNDVLGLSRNNYRLASGSSWSLRYTEWGSHWPGFAAFGLQLFDLFCKNAPLTSGSFESRSYVWVCRRRQNLALRGMGEAFLFGPLMIRPFLARFPCPNNAYESSPARIPNSGRWELVPVVAYGDGGEEGEALRISWLSCKAMLLSSSVARISAKRSITAVSALI